MTIRTGVVQFEHAAGDNEKNFAKIEAFSADAARDGVQILALRNAASRVTGG